MKRIPNIISSISNCIFRKFYICSYSYYYFPITHIHLCMILRWINVHHEAYRSTSLTTHRPWNTRLSDTLQHNFCSHEICHLINAKHLSLTAASTHYKVLRCMNKFHSNGREIQRCKKGNVSSSHRAGHCVRCSKFSTKRDRLSLPLATSAAALVIGGGSEPGPCYVSGRNNSRSLCEWKRPTVPRSIENASLPPPRLYANRLGDFFDCGFNCFGQTQNNPSRGN